MQEPLSKLCDVVVDLVKGRTEHVKIDYTIEKDTDIVIFSYYADTVVAATVATTSIPGFTATFMQPLLHNTIATSGLILQEHSPNHIAELIVEQIRTDAIKMYIRKERG